MFSDMGLRSSMSVYKYDGSPTRHVGIRSGLLVSDQTYQSPMGHVSVSDEACRFPMRHVCLRLFSDTNTIFVNSLVSRRFYGWSKKMCNDLNKF